MKYIQKIVAIALLMGTALQAQEVINNSKVDLRSTNGVSLFQSTSSNGVWATGTITADRVGAYLKTLQVLKKELRLYLEEI